MGAGGLAAYEKTIGAELRHGVTCQPQRRTLAVIQRRGERVLGGEAVVDAEHGEPRGTGEVPQPLVLPIGRAEHPAAAMHMQVYALDHSRDQDPQLHTCPVDLNIPVVRLSQTHRRRVAAQSIAPQSRQHHGIRSPRPVRTGLRLGLECGVERCGFGEAVKPGRGDIIGTRAGGMRGSDVCHASIVVEDGDNVLSPLEGDPRHSSAGNCLRTGPRRHTASARQPTPCLRHRLVQNHPNQQGERIVGQQLVRLVNLAQMQAHAFAVALPDSGQPPDHHPWLVEPSRGGTEIAMGTPSAGPERHA